MLWTVVLFTRKQAHSFQYNEIIYCKAKYRNMRPKQNQGVTGKSNRVQASVFLSL